MLVRGEKLTAPRPQRINLRPSAQLAGNWSSSILRLNQRIDLDDAESSCGTCTDVVTVVDVEGFEVEDRETDFVVEVANNCPISLIGS